MVCQANRIMASIGVEDKPTQMFYGRDLACNARNRVNSARSQQMLSVKV